MTNWLSFSFGFHPGIHRVFILVNFTITYVIGLSSIGNFGRISRAVVRPNTTAEELKAKILKLSVKLGVPGPEFEATSSH